MSNGLLVAGVVCMIVAIVAAGMKMLGVVIAELSHVSRQIMLFTIGLVFVLASLSIGKTPAATNIAPTSDEGDTCSVQALTCLPRSSAPVVFRNDVAANAAAALNVKDGLSTPDARAAAEKLGASGKASGLCGIVQSDDASPLGKHVAAARLANPRPGDGQATEACMKMADAFL